VELIGGVDRAKDLLKQIADHGEIIGVSSVYKRFATKELLDLNARIEFVVRFESTLDVEQQLDLVLSLATTSSPELGGGGAGSLTLLCVNNLILMSPKLTLPYPQMHTDPLIIRCAAELWPSYEHPIYQKTLAELVKMASPVKYTEFFMQGKSLVDF
jgi:7,8-dihydro-6-hydroxymethylpterin-pyrophosphokinase